MPHTRRTNYRVLLVEDDAGDAMLVKRFLTAQDDVRTFELIHVWSLQQALESLAEHTFDVVLSDVHLPDARGAEVIKALVEHDLELPVVALTGHDDHALGMATIEAGAEQYLTKDSIDPLGLRRTLTHTFARVRERRRVALRTARQHQRELTELNEELRREAQARARAQERVEAVNRELERSNRDLQNFAQVASHDLKAPLKAVARLVSWLEADLTPIAPAPSRAHLAQLQRRVSRMLQMLDDVLAWARVGHIDAPAESVDVHALITEIWDGLDAARFELVIASPLPTLHTYREPLALVFRNLLTNAVRHHDRAAGRVELEHQQTPRAHLFRVRDDGPGIPPTLHERVFKLFGVGRPDASRGGVGLAMVRRALSELGGEIELSQNTGRGATFVVTWPASTRPRDP